MPKAKIHTVRTESCFSVLQFKIKNGTKEHILRAHGNNLHGHRYVCANTCGCLCEMQSARTWFPDLTPLNDVSI